MTDDARGRVRALAGRGFDEPGRRWLISPEGLLTACQQAVADHDLDFFDQVESSPLLGQLDDESLRTVGPRPSDRASGLMCAGRLTHWCLRGGADRPRLVQWLEAAVRGLSPPAVPSGSDLPPWTTPAGMLDTLDPISCDPCVRVIALVEALHRSAAQPAALALGDLVRHFLPGSDGPKTTGRTSVLILTSRHREGELVHLVLVEREGPPGISLDLLSGPFTRADAAFAVAVETAWRATRLPSLSARWAVISDRTGAALDVIEGRSVGAGAALGLHYLTNPALPPLDPSWAITGAVDTTGALGSLLENDHNLATYRTKLVAAGTRSVVVPRSDHPYIAGLVESGGVKASLVPAASVAEIVSTAERVAAARRAYLDAVQPPPEPLPQNSGSSRAATEPETGPYPPPPPAGPSRGPGRRRLVVALALDAAVLLAGGIAVIAGVGSGGPGPPTTPSTTGSSTIVNPPRPPGPLVFFTFDDLPVGTVGSNRLVTDTSGNRNAGTVRVLSGGLITVVARTPGDNAIKFPAPCPPELAGACPRAIIQTEDPSNFDAADRDFAYGAQVLVSPSEVSPGAAILNKGRVTRTDDSEWKLQLEADGRASCVAVLPGGGGSRRAGSIAPIADGTWHQVTCTRIGDELRIDVDGGATARVALPPGFRFETDAPLRLGGHSGQQDNAQYFGSLDNVFFRLSSS